MNKTSESIGNDARFQELLYGYSGTTPEYSAWSFTRLIEYIDSRAPAAQAASVPYAYEESDGDTSDLVYAAWFTSGRGKMDPNKTYEPLYRAPQQEGSEASNGN